MQTKNNNKPFTTSPPPSSLALCSSCEENILINNGVGSLADIQKLIRANIHKERRKKGTEIEISIHSDTNIHHTRAHDYTYKFNKLGIFVTSLAAFSSSHRLCERVQHHLLTLLKHCGESRDNHSFLFIAIAACRGATCVVQYPGSL